MKFYKIHLGSIELELDLLEEYVKETADNNKDKLDKYSQQIEKLLKELGENQAEYKDHLEDSKDDLHYKLGFEFPNFSIRANIVQLYSLLENNLNTVCKVVQKEMKLGFSKTDLKGGSDLEKCKLYLNKGKNVNISALDSWNKIIAIKAIRNNIIHNNSLLSKKDKHYKLVKDPVEEALEKYPELSRVHIHFISKPKAKISHQAIPVNSSLIKNREKRKYKIIIADDQEDHLDSTLFKNLEYISQVGIMGHELAHISDYHDESSFNILVKGMKYVLSKKFRIRYERETNLNAIKRGLKEEIHSWSRETHSYLVNDNRGEYYHSPIEIEKMQIE